MRKMFGAALAAAFLMMPAAAMAQQYNAIAATDGDKDSIIWESATGKTKAAAMEAARSSCSSIAGGLACKAIAWKGSAWWAIVTCKHGDNWTSHMGADDTKREAIRIARRNGDRHADPDDESICPLVYSGSTD